MKFVATGEKEEKKEINRMNEQEANAVRLVTSSIEKKKATHFFIDDAKILFQYVYD